MRKILIIMLSVLALVGFAAPAQAAKAAGGYIAIDQPAHPGNAFLGDTVPFLVLYNADAVRNLNVDVACTQPDVDINGNPITVTVYSETKPAPARGSDVSFTLTSPLWVSRGGNATCTALLYDLVKKGNSTLKNYIAGYGPFTAYGG